MFQVLISLYYIVMVFSKGFDMPCLLFNCRNCLCFSLLRLLLPILDNKHHLYFLLRQNARSQSVLRHSIVFSSSNIGKIRFKLDFATKMQSLCASGFNRSLRLLLAHTVYVLLWKKGKKSRELFKQSLLDRGHLWNG